VSGRAANGRRCGVAEVHTLMARIEITVAFTRNVQSIGGTSAKPRSSEL